MEMIFHLHANKTHVHKKSCALGLILKMRVFGTWKWLIVFGLNFIFLGFIPNHTFQFIQYKLKLIHVRLESQHMHATLNVIFFCLFS